MIKTVKDVGVDAGMIVICDKDYYKKYNDELKFDLSSTKILKVKPGTYSINWIIENTWNGDISGQEILNIKSGEIIISDPCYCVKSENWDKWLSDTDYGLCISGDAFVINNMGGDGTYDLDLELQIVERI